MRKPKVFCHLAQPIYYQTSNLAVLIWKFKNLILLLMSKLALRIHISKNIRWKKFALFWNSDSWSECKRTWFWEKRSTVIAIHKMGISYFAIWCQYFTIIRIVRLREEMLAYEFTLDLLLLFLNILFIIRHIVFYLLSIFIF